ncbi:hypothetical protein R4514_12520 [Acinetobacter baumannii]|nr:hypothetical protein [Acinetobacter baumannii]
MLFDDEDLEDLNFLKDYAKLINEIYEILSPYYFDKSRVDVYKGAIEKLFFDIKDQMIVIDQTLPSITLNISYLQSTINEYSNRLEEFVKNNTSAESLLLNTLKNIYSFSRIFLLEENPSSLSLFSVKLSKQQSFHNFISKINSSIKLLSDEKQSSPKEIFAQISEIEDRLSLLDSKVNYNGKRIEDEIDSFLKKNKNEFSSEAELLLLNLKEDFINIDNELKNDISSGVENLKSELNTQIQELKTFAKDVHSYKSVVSQSTVIEVSQYYSQKAKEEKKVYYTVTIFSLLIITFSITLAWFSLSKYYNNYVNPKGLKDTITGLTPTEVEWVQQAAFLYLSLRLVISVLLFLTIIYTGRIAYRAYLHWRHSENTYLKLSSLNPFISDLPEDIRTQIRLNLIPDFFGKDAGNFDSVSESFKDLPTNVSALAAKAIEQVGNNLNGKSNTEKNDKKAEDPSK